ncbi:NAD(P)/FAD-dependent oxidoreductase [Spirosoma rhododendri]|uniref:NAD(P)/FAD-dependent oxidoreductase n=1 Tax=Spirosoma rhododendri TaxID=2728024 RepID=A0A7L5DK68_9BACT|nr:NAD(P)/FAD-dependent oxidoreductase [Spirosoma rhododendri]QJD78854.1 NAD(P)/FAD-dependent oxidoreductase [Spirosoma rhododendri]
MNYDVIIIGGSYAGLSAALVLGRSLRRVLVIDAGKPCNRRTPHSHGFLTRDGETPAQLAAIAREQVSHYPTVTFKAGTATNASLVDSGFQVRTDDGESYSARKLILATGLLDVMPDIPGFSDCWGRSVLHCPYCHGYEVHGQPLGVLANGETGYDMATLIQQWSRQLTLFTNGPSTLTDEQQQVLARLAIPIVETPLAAIEHTDGFLTALQLADGSRVMPKALFARVPLKQTSDIAVQLGCELTDQTFVKVTETGETTVPNVFAVGDVTTMMRQVAVAVASGVKTGAWINRVLIADDLKLSK